MSDLHLTNAAGYIKSDDDEFRKLLRSAVNAVVFGSITVGRRAGNSGANFVMLDDGTSVNSLGLPNHGIAEYEKTLPRIIDATRKAGKKFILSIAPLSLEDFGVLSNFAQRLGVDELEGNLGCPNVHYGGERKPIFAYGLLSTKDGVAEMRREWKGALRVKLSPYTDIKFAKDMATMMDALLEDGEKVVLTNTLPDYSPTDKGGKSLLQAVAPDGKPINAGGMAGTGLKEHSLRNLRIFRKHMRGKVSIVSAGGIATGKDIHERLKKGAHECQIGTAYFRDGNVRIFTDVLEEYAACA